MGTVIGALGAGQVGQKLGSRETLRLTAILYVVSAVGCGLAWNWDSFMVFRFIGGLGIGASSVLGPVYIAELAPAKWRGRMVAAFQFNVVFGIMVAYTSNYFIRTMHLGATEWRWQVGVAAFPAIAFLALLRHFDQRRRRNQRILGVAAQHTHRGHRVPGGKARHARTQLLDRPRRLAARSERQRGLVDAVAEVDLNEVDAYVHRPINQFVQRQDWPDPRYCAVRPGNGTTSTVTFQILSGNIPITDTLISIGGRANAAGAYNATNAQILSVILGKHPRRWSLHCHFPRFREHRQGG